MEYLGKEMFPALKKAYEKFGAAKSPKGQDLDCVDSIMGGRVPAVPCNNCR